MILFSIENLKSNKKAKNIFKNNELLKKKSGEKKKRNIKKINQFSFQIIKISS